METAQRINEQLWITSCHIAPHVNITSRHYLALPAKRTLSASCHTTSSTLQVVPATYSQSAIIDCNNADMTFRHLNVRSVQTETHNQIESRVHFISTFNAMHSKHAAKRRWQDGVHVYRVINGRSYGGMMTDHDIGGESA
jgi:hypothetical protein